MTGRDLKEVIKGGLELLLFAIIYVSCLLAWMFFFMGAIQFTVALMDAELADSIAILLLIGTFANSIYLAGISAHKTERLFTSIKMIFGEGAEAEKRKRSDGSSVTRGGFG